MHDACVCACACVCVCAFNENCLCKVIEMITWIWTFGIVVVLCSIRLARVRRCSAGTITILKRL